MSAVDEDRQLDGARPAEIHQRVERGADRAAGVEHVVHQDHLAIVDGEWDVGSFHGRLLAGPAEVVAIEGDVDDAARDLDTLDRGRFGGEALCDLDAERAHADEHEVPDAFVALEDLVRHAGERTLHSLCVEHHSLRRSHGKKKPPRRRGGSKLDYRCRRCWRRTSEPFLASPDQVKGCSLVAGHVRGVNIATRLPGNVTAHSAGQGVNNPAQRDSE
jgi:hypothetical protein